METATVLLGTAASVAMVHTALGPDHYLPFVALSKAKRWSMTKTLLLTLLCGIGHVGSSVVIGLVGILLGWGLTHVEGIEASRALWAAWGMTIFGALYMLWGLYHAFHQHPHQHKDATTPWTIFIIFVLGPCEPLIPLLMYPAAQNSMTLTLAVSLLFSTLTVATMLLLVWLLIKGTNLIKPDKLIKYAHAIAGAIILSCGIVMLCGG